MNTLSVSQIDSFCKYMRSLSLSAIYMIINWMNKRNECTHTKSLERVICSKWENGREEKLQHRIDIVVFVVVVAKEIVCKLKFKWQYIVFYLHSHVVQMYAAHILIPHIFIGQKCAIVLAHKMLQRIAIAVVLFYGISPVPRLLLLLFFFFLQ